MISLLLLFNTIFCKLEVISPQAAQTDFPNGIPNSIGNFGHVPYGMTLIGQAVKGSPYNGCQSQSIGENFPNSFFLVVERGECPFVTKASYAQMIGAKMLIVIDDTEEDSTELNMADNGRGYLLNIPGILIKREDGLKLIKYLDEKQKESLNLSIMFKRSKSANVNVIFWLTKSDVYSFKMLYDFDQYKSKLTKIKFTPRYHITDGQYYSDDEKLDLCIGNGRYCLPSYEYYGGEIHENAERLSTLKLIEILVQLCVYKVYPKMYFKYMELYSLTCYLSKETYDGKKETLCSEDITDKLQLSFDPIYQCIKKSYNLTNDQDVDTQIIEKNQNTMQIQMIFITIKFIFSLPLVQIMMNIWVIQIEMEFQKLFVLDMKVICHKCVQNLAQEDRLDQFKKKVIVGCLFLYLFQQFYQLLPFSFIKNINAKLCKQKWEIVLIKWLASIYNFMNRMYLKKNEYLFYNCINLIIFKFKCLNSKIITKDKFSDFMNKQRQENKNIININLILNKIKNLNLKQFLNKEIWICRRAENKQLFLFKLQMNIIIRIKKYLLINSKALVKAQSKIQNQLKFLTNLLKKYLPNKQDKESDAKSIPIEDLLFIESSFDLLLKRFSGLNISELIHLITNNWDLFMHFFWVCQCRYCYCGSCKCLYMNSSKLLIKGNKKIKYKGCYINLYENLGHPLNQTNSVMVAKINNQIDRDLPSMYQTCYTSAFTKKPMENLVYDVKAFSYKKQPLGNTLQKSFNNYGLVKAYSETKSILQDSKNISENSSNQNHEFKKSLQKKILLPSHMKQKAAQIFQINAWDKFKRQGNLCSNEFKLKKYKIKSFIIQKLQDINLNIDQ